MTTAAKVVDFDAFRREQTSEPVQLVIGKETYELPPSLPAAVAVDLIRLKATLGEDEGLPLDTMDKFGQAIFGDELWRLVLVKHRITLTELPDLMQQVLEVYSEDPKMPSMAKAPASTVETKGSSSGSSRTGRGSKRTSSGSTAST